MTSDTPRGSAMPLFLAIVVASAALAGGYAWWTRADRLALSTEPMVIDPAAIAQAVQAPHLLVRSTVLDAAYGHLSLVPAARPDGDRLTTPLSCERVHMASGHGVCLAADRGIVTSYRAELFDAAFAVRHVIPIDGVPSRTRVAPDGGLAALTYFVRGDSYLATGFSTRTLILDWASGRVLGNLEQFAVTRDGRPFSHVDFNFWGVTFTREPGRFYATLASGGRTFLVSGDVHARAVTVVREGVECPAISPDNTRIAFKHRLPGLVPEWRLHVLDLATGTETPLAETRHVDDQVEWLDDTSILYALPDTAASSSARLDVWMVAADGTGPPRRLVPEGNSPVAGLPAR